MKLLFCIFSGTGNTRRVGELLAAELNALGHETELYAVKRGVPMPIFSGYDALIVGYPVHAFNAPTPFLAFLKQLPKAENMPVYLMRSSGEPLRLNDASGITPKRILKKRGYSVVGEFSYVMPYNIIFRHSDKMAARMWQTAKTRAKRDASLIDAGGGTKRRVGPFRRMAAFALRIEHTAMPLVGRRFRVREGCIGCGKCAAVCPQGNITMKDGRPVFGKSCVGCMACAFGCPKDAVSVSLFNSWRVNGAYSFEGDAAADEEVCKYCHKSYLRYFHETENGAETGHKE